MPTVTIQPTGEVIYLEPGETVLSGLYKAGFAYTVGCRRGGCGICKVDCRSGEFRYDHPVADTVLTEDERRPGFRRSGMRNVCGPSHSPPRPSWEDGTPPPHH